MKCPITAIFYAGSMGIGLTIGIRHSVFEQPEAWLVGFVVWLAWLWLCDRVARMPGKGVTR